ncbi:SigE family RNA polymerase sigma factor [Plantactinospora siamensis]|uniref:SigE family RNA polymerase sigma factor n=1 Tax=Plantactinospora siamensis TaxID=555372 RepID=A0ABV6NXD8_9ACTN
MSTADQEYLDYLTGRLPALRRLAWSLCGDPDQVDDLVQETVTKLYLHWSRTTRADNMDAYVRTVLVRVFLDGQRKGWWRVRLFGATPDVERSPAVDVAERADLRAALGRVPPRQRAVLVLRFLHDLPVDEVARLLGCSAGTVKSQTSHGLAALRRLLSPGPPGAAPPAGGERPGRAAARGTDRPGGAAVRGADGPGSAAACGTDRPGDAMSAAGRRVPADRMTRRAG